MTHDRLSSVVERAARAYPKLDRGTLEARDRGGGLVTAAVAHAPAVAAPRAYRAEAGEAAVFFDGLPVDRLGDLAAHDAEVLLERWPELPERLEGVFSAIRVDGRSGEVECLLDVLGMAQVYVVRDGAAWALSNNVEVLRLVSEVAEPDPLGLSSMLTLGWVAGDRTLLKGVEVLPGGHLHRLGARITARPLLSPATVVPRASPPPRAARELAAAMTRTMAALPRSGGPLSCGLTAGRDSRVIVALALAAGLDVDYFTSGSPDHVDVRRAAELAGRLGLRHRVIAPEVPRDPAQWARQTAAFSAQSDGIASLWDVGDWAEHQVPLDRLGVKLWGPGGEIGRSARIGVGIPFMANAPGLRRSWRAQRWVLEQKTACWGGLVTPEGAAETRRYLDRYVDERRREGWRAREVLESYYAFERVKHWAASGVRRASEATDIFAPFVSRDYIEYCYALTPAQRYAEAAHHRLLGALAPELRDQPPFDAPWKPQRPRAATVHATVTGAGWALRRMPGAARRSPPRPPSFAARWYAAGRPLHREMATAFPSSPVWDFVDRRRYEQLVAAEPGPHVEGLCRALTALWYLHGRHEAPATT